MTFRTGAHRSVTRFTAVITSKNVLVSKYSFELRPARDTPPFPLLPLPRGADNLPAPNGCNEILFERTKTRVAKIYEVVRGLSTKM